MKALYCGRCSAIVSGPVDGSWRWCDCGNAAIRWTNPVRGLAEVWADVRALVRVIGLNNRMLHLALTPAGNLNDNEVWRELHQQTTRDVEPHYLFHADKRACWAVIIRPNETADVRFADERPPR